MQNGREHIWKICVLQQSTLSTLAFSGDTNKIFALFILNCKCLLQLVKFFHSLWLHKSKTCIVPLQRTPVIIKRLIICIIFFPQAKFLDFKIQNMVGSCDVKFPIRLEGLVLTHGQFSRYRNTACFIVAVCVHSQTNHADGSKFRPQVA